MERKRRIRLVGTLALAIFATFMGAVGVPLIGICFMSNPLSSSSENIDEMARGMNQTFQYIHMINYACFACLAFAGCCFLFLIVDLAIWFIGPAETKESEETA